jgi:hypothetical protein
MNPSAILPGHRLESAAATIYPQQLASSPLPIGGLLRHITLLTSAGRLIVSIDPNLFKATWPRRPEPAREHGSRWPHLQQLRPSRVIEPCHAVLFPCRGCTISTTLRVHFLLPRSGTAAATSCCRFIRIQKAAEPMQKKPRKTTRRSL